LADVEAKKAVGGLPKSLPQTISAFANGNGGLIILGLDEENGFVPAPIDAKSLAVGLAGMCRDSVEPAVLAEIDIALVDGQSVVAAEIPPGDHMRLPYYVKTQGMDRGSFLRGHDGDRHLTSYEVHALVAGRGQPRDDLQIVDGATIEDLDPDLVVALIGRLRDTRGSVFAKASDAEILRFVQVLDRDRFENKVTLAGLLTLGRYPQQFFPQLDITFAAFPTSETGVPMSDGTRFLDNASLDGPIPVVITQALAAVRRNMTRRSVIRGAGRQDHWEYPEEAVRELLGNALMHRDYFPLTHGTQVRVEMYPDRLEVISPGGLFGDFPPSSLLHEAVSSSRNAALAKLLEDVTYPGTNQTVCENRGTGLLAVSAIIRQEGMNQPELESRIAEFRVTLRNSELAKPATPADSAQPLSDSKQRILELLGTGPKTARELSTHTGLQVVTVRAYIKTLESAGLIRPTQANKRSPRNAWQLL